jgi:hypothetical protein
VLHPFIAAVAHGIEERLAFTFAFPHVFAGAHGVFENLNGGDSSAALTRHQTLRNDVTEGLGKTRADGLLVGQRENTDGAFDSFRGVDGMQRGKNQVPVSEASSAISIVSRSRISPTRITFGAWRSAARSASEKVGVSLCSSR